MFSQEKPLFVIIYNFHSNSCSFTFLFLEAQVINVDTSKESAQSSHHNEKGHEDVEETIFILKVSLSKIAVLVSGDIDNTTKPREDAPVIQMLSSALIMFQSVEDSDGSGSKTFHVSLEDYSVSINSQFQPMSPSQLSPVLSPIAIDFRSVNSTQNSGIVMRREVSLSCDTLKSSFQVNDLRTLSKVTEQLLKEIRSIDYSTNDNNSCEQSLKGQERGSLITTSLKFQLQPFSFILLRNFRDRGVTCPLLDIRGEAYGKVEGCSPTLYGESKIEMSLHFYSNNTSEWEYVIEPASIVIDFEQQLNHKVSLHRV